MNKAYSAHLKSVTKTLTSNLDPDNELRHLLVVIFTDEQNERIYNERNNPTRAARVHAMLDFLLRMPDDAYVQFWEAVAEIRPDITRRHPLPTMDLLDSVNAARRQPLPDVPTGDSLRTDSAEAEDELLAARLARLRENKSSAPVALLEKH